MDRAYSFFEVKAFDGDRRVITGLASTPTLDRDGDVVEPFGATFAKSIPLLLRHNHALPVGTVTSLKPTEKGIEFEAKLPEIPDAGTLRDRVEEAWQSIKAGLIRGVSIGFLTKGKDIERLASGIRRIAKFEILELSLVAVPANAEATIHSIKSLDAAALGTSPDPKHVGTPGVTGAVVRLATKGATTTMKTYTEQITQWEATRAAKIAERDNIMAKSVESGETLDQSDAEKHDTLNAEIKNIDAHLVRLRESESTNVAAAKAVVDIKTPEEGAAARDIKPVAVSVKSTLPEGMEFARMVLCKVRSFVECQKGNFVSALDIAKQVFPDNPRIHKYLQHKTAVAGGTTTDATWAAPLLADARTLETEFLEYLRPQTIVGKFGTNGIPSLRRVPFNVRIQAQSVAGSANWVGQGKPKPVTKFGYTDQTLLFTKIASIAVITEELARFSQPGAEGLVRDALRDTVVAKLDTDFIDPAVAASAGVNPASITNGLVALSSAGTSAANVLTDLQNLIETFILANVNPNGLVLIMPNTLALVLSLMENSLGQPAFSGLTMNGGTLRGIPVITSQYAASGASFGNMVIAVNARDVALADDGQVTVDASREASIQMDDAPSNDATTGTGQSLVSMWQTNSIALRAERTINWAKLRNSAVAYMDDVNWGAIGSPA